MFQKSQGITELYLGYDNVLMNRTLALQYTALLRKHGIYFATTGRVDQIDETFIAQISRYLADIRNTVLCKRLFKRKFIGNVH